MMFSRRLARALSQAPKKHGLVPKHSHFGRHPQIFAFQHFCTHSQPNGTAGGSSSSTSSGKSASSAADRKTGSLGSLSGLCSLNSLSSLSDPGYADLSSLREPGMSLNSDIFHKGGCKRSQLRASTAEDTSKEPDTAEAVEKTLFQRAHDKLEKHGDIVVTTANILQLIGFACYDSLYLQSLMIFGNGCMALFFITRMQPLQVACGWALLKVAVNIFMVCSILWYRQPIKLAPDELAVYEEHFMHSGVSARQFKRFWDEGEYRVVPKGGCVNIEGTPVHEVTLVTAGKIYKTRKGKHVKSLDSYPGKRHTSEGDSGCWSGASTLLQLMDDVPKHTTVSRDKAHKASNEDEYERICHLQRILAKHGLYDGEIDGYAGKRTVYALSKLQEHFMNQTFSHLEELHDILSSHTDILQSTQDQVAHGFSHTTHVMEDATVRVWQINEVLKLTDSDTETRGAVRKAFTRSTIKKLTALFLVEHSSKPSVEGVATEDVLQHYRQALGEAVKPGRILPEDKVVLGQFRKQHHVSDGQHATALKVVGWTLEEYELGARSSALGDVQFSKAGFILHGAGMIDADVDGV